jgi:signal peptidase
LFITGLVVAGLFLVGQFTGKRPFSAYIVSSGSMEPAVKTGSVVIVSPKPDYQVGDVVTFYTGPDKKATTTHRIVGMDDQVFKFAGDANNQPDMALIPRSRIIGEVRLSIPYLGYLAAFAKTPHGFILLVIVPATIIVYEELRSLFSEIKTGLKKLSKRREQMEASRLDARNHAHAPSVAREHVEDGMPNPRSAFLLKPAIILPIFFALLIPLTLSISYFIDRETSSGNSIAVPTPTPLLIHSFSVVEPAAETTDVLSGSESAEPGLPKDATESAEVLGETEPATESATIEPTPTDIPLPTETPIPAPTTELIEN